MKSHDDSLHLLAALVSQQLPATDIQDHQWPELCALASQHGLAPMLHWVARKSSLDPTSDPRLAQLIQEANIAALQYALLRNAQARLEQAYLKAGIPTLWIKGIALAQSLYPEPELRSMFDLDLLVPLGQKISAVHIAQASGYKSLVPDGHIKRLEFFAQFQSEYQFIGGTRDLIHLDLHTRLFGLDVPVPISFDQMDWFWNQIEKLPDDKNGFWVLRPEANLLYLCAHTILKHGFDPSLVRYFDLHLLISKSALDWRLIVDRSIDLRWSYAVERVLTQTQQYFTTPIPEWIFNELRVRRSTSETTSYFTGLPGEGARWKSTMSELSHYSLKQRVQRIFALTYPPAQYMRQRYAIPPGQTVLPFYFYRWFDAGREAANALRHSKVRSSHRN